MALSRIWSAFIIIAILVAGFKYFSGNGKQVFTSMVIGKSGDSVLVKETAISVAEAETVKAL
ncbi:MAG: spore maturation protein, partial [Chitinophagaceae bacterium]